jgi:hypothetical protein
MNKPAENNIVGCVLEAIFIAMFIAGVIGFILLVFTSPI